MRVVFCALVLSLMLLAGSGRPALAHVDDLSAIAVFRLLPFQLLDNLSMALSDQERQQLAAYGISDNWFVLRSSRDLLEIRSIESGQSIRLCLYRSELGIVAAMGVDLGPLCSSELWYINPDSMASPLDFPNQPRAREFFDLPEDLSREVRASTSFCPHPDGLEVRPLFWSTQGQQDLEPDFAIFYFWNGAYFSKRVIDRQGSETGR